MSESRPPYFARRKRRAPQPAAAVTNAPTEPIPAPDITLKLEGGYLIVRCGDAYKVARLFWEHPHGEFKQKLVLRECDEVPRHLEGLVYGEGEAKR